MLRKINLLYPLQVWGTTIVLSAIIFSAMISIHSGRLWESFTGIPVFIWFCLISFWPLLIGTYLSLLLISIFNLQELLLKFLLIFTCSIVLLVVLQWYEALNVFSIPLFVTLVVAMFFYKPYSKNIFSIQKFDLVAASEQINPHIGKGCRGTVLEVWEDGSLEVEFQAANGQNIEYDGRKTFTVQSNQIILKTIGTFN